MGDNTDISAGGQGLGNAFATLGGLQDWNGLREKRAVSAWVFATLAAVLRYALYFALGGMVLSGADGAVVALFGGDGADVFRRTARIVFYPALSAWMFYLFFRVMLPGWLAAVLARHARAEADFSTVMHGHGQRLASDFNTVKGWFRG